MVSKILYICGGILRPQLLHETHKEWELGLGILGHFPHVVPTELTSVSALT